MRMSQSQSVKGVTAAKNKHCKDCKGGRGRHSLRLDEFHKQQAFRGCWAAVRPYWSQPTGRAQLVAAHWSRPTGRRVELVAANWSHKTTGRGQLVAKLENSFSEITLKIFYLLKFFSYTISSLKLLNSN